MSSFSRLRATLVAVAALAILALGASSAQAAKVHYAGGTTSVTPSAAAVKVLSDAGIAVTPVAPASATGGVFSFPIARGFVDPATGRADLLHKGGLKFTKGAKSATLRRFIIRKSAKAKAATLLARAPKKACKIVLRQTKKHGKKKAHRKAVRVCRWHQRYFAAARVTDIKVSSDGTAVSGTLRITKTTAQIFNKVAGKKVVKAGAVLGTGSSTVKTS
jgi:hypothetical protein